MASYKTSDQIRTEFLQFFEQKQHTIVPSDAIVPHNDKTLLFTNAGMNQFKDVFLGTGTRPYKRAVDTQKCLRVSGKHNDLEEVGYDTYHHTMFEMLGNWSFGDYFKKEAIRWAWELLVEKWGLDPSRLYATVHEGDEKLGLAPDEEAAALWRSETSINPSHIKYCNSKDNFWMMGDTGPSGPCSEIHVDLRSDEERAEVSGFDLVNADDPRVMEIWNLVFIQYNAQADGSLEPLADKHVDTGMGFERIVAVLQEKTSNYDTDLFTPLLGKIAQLAPLDGLNSYTDMGGSEEEQAKVRIAMRVIADHIRAIAFAVADGVSPGNVGQGYVIRRILRRAVRYGYQTLGFREPFLFELVEPLKAKMGGSFPELEQRQSYVERVIKAEEHSFLETLGIGIAYFDHVVPHVHAIAAGEAGAQDALAEDRLLNDLLQKAFPNIGGTKDRHARFAEVAQQKDVAGDIAFLLHDTYGFPVDLTQLMAREAGLGVDMVRYQVRMQEQKDRARSAKSFRVDQSKQNAWVEVSDGEDSYFVGYDTDAVEQAHVRAARTIETDQGEVHQLVLDQTPFYAESGGQVGDTGILTLGEETVRVLDTQKQDRRIVHVVDRLPEALDAPFAAQVDTERRQRIIKHHSVTHLLHAALRETLGSHVAQKGSLVAPDRLRFDFSHFERVSKEQLRAIEQQVNTVIQRNIEKQEDRDVPIEEAMARGATALFGEKYGDTVRVITFDPMYSVELCGGIHVDATGEIGLFRFVSEGSVAAGIRRVEGVAGLDAVQLVEHELDELQRVRDQFRGLQRPVDEEVESLQAAIKDLEKQNEALRQEALASSLDAFMQQGEQLDGVRVVTGRLADTDMNTLRSLGETLRDRMGAASVGVLGTADPEGGKVYLVASVSDDVIKGRGLKAGALVGLLAKRVGGGGGGRPNLATAGGRKPEELDSALQAVPSVVQSLLG